MTHLRAHRNGVLCLLAVTAIAGCATATRGVSTPAPASVANAASASSANPAPDTSAVDQQVSSIDNQLSAINGQLNAANAGLSTSEGDPAQ
jgi:TolA-binding protein